MLVIRVFLSCGYAKWLEILELVHDILNISFNHAVYSDNDTLYIRGRHQDNVRDRVSLVVAALESLRDSVLFPISDRIAERGCLDASFVSAWNADSGPIQWELIRIYALRVSIWL